MIQKTRGLMAKLGEDKGFTLVEMALVLIIIGIIIGAIVKGKDLVRGAEQKRVYSKFLSEWRLAYLNFYDRTGKVLGDTEGGGADGQNGQADTSHGTTAAPDNTGRDELISGDADGTVDYLGLNNVGLEVPVTNISGVPYQYNYVNSQGNTNTLDIAFDWDTGSNYNFMMIQNIPIELALAIDRMIDGESDGQNGDFLNGNGSSAWSTNPVATTTARWKMKF